MNSPRLLRSLPLGLLLALVTSLVLSLGAAPAVAAKNPNQDFPRMPKKCATAKEKIPPTGKICMLTTFRADRPTVLLWGDSHAWMMIPALRAAARDQDVNLAAMVMGGCPPMDNKLKAGQSAPGCFKGNDLALQFVRNHLRNSDHQLRVLLGGSWGRYWQAVKTGDRSYTGEMGRQMKKSTPALMKTLARLGVATDIIGQVATVPAKPAPCKRTRPYVCDVPRKQALRFVGATTKWLKQVSAPLAGTRAPIDVNGAFCAGKVCKGKVGKVFTWWDELHISATMSTRLRGHLTPTVQRLLEADAAAGGGNGNGNTNGNGGGGPICSVLPFLC